MKTTFAILFVIMGSPVYWHVGVARSASLPRGTLGCPKMEVLLLLIEQSMPDVTEAYFEQLCP